MFNATMVLVTFAVLYAFTDIILDVSHRDNAGWAVIVIFLFIALVNWMVAVYLKLKEVYLKLK